MTTLLIILALIAVAVCGLLFLPFLKRSSTMKRSITPPVLASLFVLGVTFGLYSFMGSPRLLPILDQHEQKVEDLEQQMIQLESEVAKTPDDIALKIALGDVYTEMGRHRDAVATFKQAVLLSKGDPAVILKLGKAEMAVAAGEINDPARKAFEMVLLQDPSNLQARYYVALGLKQQGKNADALEKFESILDDLPEGIPLQTVVKRHIEELKK